MTLLVTVTDKCRPVLVFFSKVIVYSIYSYNIFGLNVVVRLQTKHNKQIVDKSYNTLKTH